MLLEQRCPVQQVSCGFLQGRFDESALGNVTTRAQHTADVPCVIAQDSVTPFDESLFARLREDRVLEDGQTAAYHCLKLLRQGTRMRYGRQVSIQFRPINSPAVHPRMEHA